MRMFLKPQYRFQKLRYNEAMRKYSAMILCLLLCGCTKDYGHSDIEDYVRNELGLTGFRVSQEAEEEHSADDDYTDYLWTVTESDGTVFHVLDDYHWGMEAVTNSLRNDRNDVHKLIFFENTPHGDLAVEDHVSEQLHYVIYTGSFSTRSELNSLVDDLSGMAERNTDELYLSYKLCYSFPERGSGPHELTEGDVTGAVIRDPLDCAEAEQNWLHTIIDYMHEDQLKDFTPEEIRAFVNEHKYAVGYRSGDSYAFYDDIIGNRFSYGVSVPAIYEILSRNGYPVTGTRERYSFRDLEGNVWEMSEDFRDEDGWYYYYNGEKSTEEFAFPRREHINLYRLKELTGLDLISRYELDQ